MSTDEEFLDGFEVERVAGTEQRTYRKRAIVIKKWSVDEERSFVDFLTDNRDFETPTAQTYYKRFAEVASKKMEWKVACSKLRNMRTAYNKAKSCEGSTGAGSMTGETMKATLLKKCHYFYAFDELFGARLVNNAIIEDTMDDSLASDVLLLHEECVKHQLILWVLTVVRELAAEVFTRA